MIRKLKSCDRGLQASAVLRLHGTRARLSRGARGMRAPRRARRARARAQRAALTRGSKCAVPACRAVRRGACQVRAPCRAQRGRVVLSSVGAECSVRLQAGQQYVMDMEYDPGFVCALTWCAMTGEDDRGETWGEDHSLRSRSLWRATRGRSIRTSSSMDKEEATANLSISTC